MLCKCCEEIKAALQLQK